MTLDDIIAGVDAVELRSGDPRVEISGVSRDSRTVESGGLFAALRGANTDGHDYLGEAVRNGAAALLVQTGAACEFDVPVVEADDTRAVLGPLGSHFFGHPSRQLDVVGITGTNGKTSTSYLLEAILDGAGRRVGVVGTVEYRWPGTELEANNTTPDGLTLQRTLRAMVDDGVDVAVVEVSSHALAQGRANGTDFAAGVFTNLSPDHVEFHGSFEAYRRAKWRLFDELLPESSPPGDRTPVAVVNVERREGRRLLEHLEDLEAIRAVGFSTKPVDSGGAALNFRAREIIQTVEGISMVVDELDGESRELEVGLPGRFNAENALAAVATARSLDVTLQETGEGLAAFAGIPGRMQRVDAPDDAPAVFVDYAHTPDALRKALETLSPLVRGQLWVVFGCGGDRDVSKRRTMGEIAGECADRIVVTSDNPRSEPPDEIIDEIAAGLEEVTSGDGDGPRWQRIRDRRDAIVEAVERAGHRDVVLIAGKGHETYQERRGRRRAFDDREVAADALRRRGENRCRR